MKRTAPGFTLIELVMMVAILSIIAAIAVPTYQYYVKKARLEQVRSLLIENVHFMEQHYARHYRFKASPDAWPELPHTATEHFDIAFTSEAKSEKPDRYRLRAKPNTAYQTTEERYLEINHHGNIKLCREKDNKIRCAPY